jgi:excisionase family DNA binding protein
MPVSQRYYSPEEFSELTGLSVKTVRRRIADGGLRAVQPGGRGTRWLIPADALDSRSNTSSIEIGTTAMEHDSDGASGPPVTVARRLPGPAPRWTGRGRPMN